MKNLSLEQILRFHTKIINATGGSDGIRDLGLIESALKNAEGKFREENIQQWIEDHQV